MKSALVPFIATLLVLTTQGGATAADCTAGQFAAAVERSAETLRAASRNFQPLFQERLRRYQAAKGLSDAEYEAVALADIDDKTLSDLDAKSSTLLLKIDGLGRIPDGKAPNCVELKDIDTLSKDLLATVKEKSERMLARLEQKIAEAEAKKQGNAKPAGKEAAAKDAPPKPSTPPRPPEPPAVAKPASTPDGNPAAKPEGENWATTTSPHDAYVSPGPPGTSAATDAIGDRTEGYSIEEVQEVTRGFFGTISTSLASVIEHAFKTTGRPTAYVLGTEGGGALLAGLRFGEGKLYMRNHSEVSKVWWHGPSIGGDIGASGTRTMFLIYRLSDGQALYRTFTGVDGSAFFVGGVGMTVLKGGDVIMAPIRSGLGFRVGASIGYVRFTASPTWNPF